MVIKYYLYILIRFFVLGLLLTSCIRREVDNINTNSADDLALSISQVLGEANSNNFKRAELPRDFIFPADHGLHPGFRNEWWYFTGNLRTHEGREFGYQLTLFTQALKPSNTNLAQINSAWFTERLWMGHLALTDVESKNHYSTERFSRENPGLAGARAEPLSLWIENWHVDSIKKNETETNAWQLNASAEEFSLSLVLQQGKPPVLHGEAGLSRKDYESGNASYYYSLTRMPTKGVLSLKNEHFFLEGNSWLDREWSTSVLGEGQTGWDWFALQLKDGRELMYYQLRDTEGNPHPLSSGTLVLPNGEVYALQSQQVILEPLRSWESPQGQLYDTAWQLTVNLASLSQSPNLFECWRVEAKVENQFMPVSIPYWEGAVAVYDNCTSSENLSGVSNKVGDGYLEEVR